MADQLRRFPSLDTDRTTINHFSSTQPTIATDQTSTTYCPSRFPSLHSTRPSTITAVTTRSSQPSHDAYVEPIGLPLSEHITAPYAPSSSIYAELPLLKPDAIRILRVKPGFPGHHLDCDLLPTSINECENRYVALSYTWERESASVPIRVNGSIFHMRRNLWEFIRTLRAPDAYIYLWADAVCIDQQSPSERNHQVQLMSKIYSSAACTQCWLGRDLPALQQHMTLAKARTQKSKGKLPARSNETTQDLLITLLDHRYWTRTWIVQEVLLAKEVWVHCGDEALCWADLISVASHFANSLHPSSLRYLQLLGDSNLMHLHRSRRSTKARGFPELLNEYADTGCEDIRDRVFGLIGLVTERHDPLYIGDLSDSISKNRKDIIDYSLPLKDLFRRLVEMYPQLPARSFAMPLWSALELDYCAFDAFEFRQRVRVQGFPCSMLTMSKTHMRPLNSASSSQDLTEMMRDELLCLSDPQSRSEARQSRVYLAIRVKPLDFQTNGLFHASACWVEPRGLALDSMGYDNLCRAFENTYMYKRPRSGGTEESWTISLSIAGLKALHAISNPSKSQRLLDALAGDILDTEDIDADLAEWADATKELSLQSLLGSTNQSRSHLVPEPISDNLLATEPAMQNSKPTVQVRRQLQQPPPRTKKRYKLIKGAHLNRFYDWVTRPVYGDKPPAWK